ncbi:MAG: ABC transporter permease subunit [bacterium]|nr:ABC transporter permease subunit [Candidatus Kapabacteria bacterium]
MIGKQRSVLGFFATGLPLVATIIIFLMIGIIVAEFAIIGVPNLSWEFITSFPRNMNTEGGIFPAIYGTLLLVIIMTIIAVPIGTITAIYLTEYARQSSIFARTIRFAVNTLAGVPSIVFGLFGVGFFIQTVGASIDESRWNDKLATMQQALVEPRAPFATSKSAPLKAVTTFLTNDDEAYWREAVRGLEGYKGGENATVTVDSVVKHLITKPELKWGKPAMIWAAFTLALLTLPVVIVSVDEALRTVPRDVREASLALGATKLETIRKVVVPNSITGILTGSILAVSRGAGEVAPILLTGAVYSLQELPTQLTDQFMHLGYHLYILATQSTDVEAARPLQYATTVVLLMLTAGLNLTAIMLRSRIRKRQFS